MACRLDHLAFVARDGLWRATVYDKAAGQSWEATADHVVLCVGHPRRCTVNEDVGSQQAVHACCVTPQELLQGGLPVTVVGDGELPDAKHDCNHIQQGTCVNPEHVCPLSKFVSP